MGQQLGGDQVARGANLVNQPKVFHQLDQDIVHVAILGVTPDVGAVLTAKAA
ncbi:MAG: hypothetical protein AAGC54_10755 [Cyanobacteria bacterium P01_F01_bin.4]